MTIFYNRKLGTALESTTTDGDLLLSMCRSDQNETKTL